MSAVQAAWPRWRRWLGWLGAGSLALAAPPLALMVSLEAPAHDGPTSDHFDGDTFSNMAPFPAHTLGEVWRLASESREAWPEFVEAPPGAPPPPRVVTGIRITWINHATVLVQVAGVNVLTDPIWSERASPFSWVGPRRHRAPGLRFEDLPPIDAVVISHNHYDHLDAATLARLIARDRPQIHAGLGTARLLARLGLDTRRAVDQDWWQASPCGSATLTFTPAQHWSARSLTDRRRTLWGSWHIRAGGHSVYFAGDTGAGPHFAAIARRLGAPEVALLPIGAYRPRWFMRPQHLDPSEAVAAHRTLGARHSLAIHWGTFRLANEGLETPVRDLAAACTRAGLVQEAFRAVPPGEAWHLGAGPTQGAVGRHR